MLMGFFLNVDNSLLDVCMKQIDDVMTEVCGSTTDCDKFTTDDTIGTASLKPQKAGSTYKITGMISFGSIKVGDGVICDGAEDSEECDKENILPVGKIGVKDYIAEVRKKNNLSGDAPKIIDSIESELNNIAGKINNVSNMIESHPKVQMCIEGRDLSQINGRGTGAKNRTSARYPNLFNNQKILIAAAALRQANDNYNKKFNKDVSEATKNADLDLAQYMCQKMAQGGGAGGYGQSPEEPGLTPPYSISYEIGGLSSAVLTGMAGYRTDTSASANAGNDDTAQAVGGKVAAGVVVGGMVAAGIATGGLAVPVLAAGAAVVGLGVLANGGKWTSSIPGGTMETSALFSRSERNCHITRVSRSRSCKNVKKNGFFGIGGSNSSECGEEKVETKHEDIKM
jgi:hypothetical protein